eukprot:jgi/Picre1/34521/NNA_001989.t1
MCIGPETTHSIAVVSEGKATTLLKQAKEYRLNHSAAEFVSSDSSVSSNISEHTEEDEEQPYTPADVVPENGMVDQGTSGDGVSTHSMPAQGSKDEGNGNESGPKTIHSPDRRHIGGQGGHAMGWESPQGILPMGHPYGHVTYAQYMAMMQASTGMPGSPTGAMPEHGEAGQPGEEEGDDEDAAKAAHHPDMYHHYHHQHMPYHHGGYPMYQGGSYDRPGSPPAYIGGGSPPIGPGFFSVPINVPGEGGSPPQMMMYGCSPPHGSPPGGQYYYVPPPPVPQDYDVSHHMDRMNLMQQRGPPSSIDIPTGTPTKKSGEARASARIARSNRAGGAYNPSDFEFNRTEALSDPDARKTIMIRNIPNKYGQEIMIDMLDKAGLSGTYDFFYLPIDFRNKCGLGYAFINFLSGANAAKLYDTFHKKRWDEYNSKKVCEIKYARVQGRDNLINHFKTAKFPSSDREYMPLIFSHQQTVSGKIVVNPNAVTIHEYLDIETE